MLDRLTPLQQRLLSLLAQVQPRLTLSGGAALVGFHTGHRVTRDLDLFLQQQRELGGVAAEVERLIEDAGLALTVIQRERAFHRLEIDDGTETVRVDLVADPVPLAELPSEKTVPGATILVDTPHQILVNKLCALLGRSELRDLWDVQALLDAGGDLRRALADAPNQDAGFSPPVLAWMVQQLAVQRLASALGYPEAVVQGLERFREDLVERLLTASIPL